MPLHDSIPARGPRNFSIFSPNGSTTWNPRCGKRTGLWAYTLVATEDGGMSVTVCNDKAGTDDSLKRARAWIEKNAPKIHVSPPAVSEGDVILNLS